MDTDVLLHARASGHAFLPILDSCDGWIVYPDPTAAWAGLAREMRRRCDLFDSGQWPATQLVPNWYPVPVTYLPDGAVRDETSAEFGPGQPW